MSSRLVNLLSTRRIIFSVGAFVVAASLALLAASATRSAESSSTPKPNTAAATIGISQISLNTSDIVYDPARNLLYASVPNTNSVVSINPATGSIVSTLTSGTTPGRLSLSDDNRYLYVGLDGSFTVRRLDLQAPGSNLEFSLGTGTVATLKAGDMEVLPGQPESVAISLRDGGFGHFAVAVYDNSTQRPNKSPQIPQNDVIEFGASASTLFGYNTTNSEFGIHKLAVDANGVSHVSTLSNALIGDADMKFDSGLLYGSTGAIIDPQALVVAGGFQLPGFGYAVEPDVANNRVYFVSAANSDFELKLWAYDAQTFLPVGNVTLSGLAGRPVRMIRCGSGGLALTTTENQLFLIQLSSIQPISANPLPTPTIGADSVIKLQLQANDLVFDPGTQKVYASIPGNVSFGNSLAPIDPMTGQVSTPVFVGSTPSKMAVSDNHQYLYVGLDGTSAVRRFDLQSQTAGLQFPLGSSPNGPLSVLDMEVQPGNPSVVAISRRNKVTFPSFEGVAIYDNGVKRPNETFSHSGSNAIEFSGTSSILYGQDTVVAGGFQKMSVDSSGITVLSTTVGVILGGGDIHYDSGLIYANNGQVADPMVPEALGAFASSGLVVPHASAGRVYMLTPGPVANSVTIFAFNSTTFVPLASQTIQGVSGTPGSFIRWGTDGLAFRTTGNQIFFLRTSTFQPYPTITPTFTTRPDGIKEFSLLTNDIAYNPADQLFYASVPSAAGSIGNSIAAINPASGLVGQPVFIGSEPYKVALSATGNVLYTTLGGVPRVRKYDINTKTPGIQFGLGSDFIHGPFWGENLAVSPSDSDVVAVTTFIPGLFPSTEVVLTRNGVVLPRKSGGNSMLFLGSHLYTYTNEVSEFGLRKLAIGSDGFSEIGFNTNLVNGFGHEIVAAEERIVGSDGAVIDSGSLTLQGKFSRTDAGIWVASDPANNRVYFLGIHDTVGTAAILTSFDATTFIQVGSATLQNVRSADQPIRRFFRYGTDGLAISTDNKIYFLSTAVITPLPPTPVPTATQISPEIKQLSLSTGDLVYNRNDGMIYASIPSRTHGFGPYISFGNSVVPINPLTGTLGQPVHVGSEPRQLKVTADGQFVWSALDGEGGVARLDVATKSLGLKFSLGNDVPFKGPRYVEDMEISPGSNSTLAISRMHKNGSPRHLSVAIYDNGIQRSETTEKPFPTGFDSKNVIEYGSSPSILYGYNNEITSFDFHRMTVNAFGVQNGTSISNLFITTDIRFDNGLIYTNGGQVVNPETLTVVGSFGGFGFGSLLVLPESATNSVFFLENNFNDTATIRVYNQTTRALIGTMVVPGVKGNIGSFIRWGTNGIAFRTWSNLTGQGNQVFIVQLPPSLTPTPVPTPTPTPTPPPGPIELLLDSSGPAVDQVAALDSILFVRDPFPIVNPANLLNAGSDQHTRVIVFVRNLQLAPGEPASEVVINLVDANNQTFDVTAEHVRPVTNQDFAQVAFRLPNLAAGACKITVKAHAMTTNSGSFRIKG
jgi:streptogramin lyase